MNFGYFHTGYSLIPAVAPPEPLPVRVWASNPGDAKPALFEVTGNYTYEQALSMVKRQGFARSLIEIK